MCFLSYTTKAQKVTGNKIQHLILILREVICYGMARMRTGYPIRVWALHLPHTIWESHGSPYGVRVTHMCMGQGCFFLINAVDQLSTCRLQYQVQLIFIIIYKHVQEVFRRCFGCMFITNIGDTQPKLNDSDTDFIPMQ